MKLKVRPSDFKVTERLAEGVLQNEGHFRVYRVRKEKVTSLEAATELAAAAGVAPADVGMAGLKDRQGVTTQFMTVHHGPSISVQRPGLSVRHVGFAERALTSEDSEGNDFQIVVRDLGPAELDHARESLEAMRTSGLPNYFDEQRFGNLRHGQGWIVLDLVHGDLEGALKRLVASASPFEPPARRRLKDALWRSFGDWGACRSIAGKLGRYHSVFEHLRRHPDDFAGAFHRVATRERLIHLYAFQSHLFNRALALHVAENAPERITLRGIEGKLRFPRHDLWLPDSWEGGLVMPGQRLEGVTDARQRDLYAQVLDLLGLHPDELVLPDVPGFQLKPEARAAVVRPIGLRVRPAEEDNEFRGRRMLRLQFGLPRGSYATLVVQRLIGPASGDGDRPPRRRGGSRRSGGGASRRRGGVRRGAARGSSRGRGRGRGGARPGRRRGR
ncbi:MAG: tRNA pseudouridine(13) synthase TruD [Planctomycetota bacterium]|nr:tRNA pseudouridine(13) synthase TruD [Planctomycetota bacterium]